MKKHSIKSVQLVIIFFLIQTTIVAQLNIEEMAYGGPAGIFVNLGTEIASLKFPSGDVTAYRIERKSEGQKEWQSIANISAPDSYSEFLDNIHRSNLLLNDSVPIIELPLKTIWEKVQQNRRLDSLKYYGNPLVVRLALGVCYLDKDVKKATVYTYRVSKLNLSGAETGTFISNQVSFPPLSEESEIVFTSKDNNSNYIRLSWKIKKGKAPVRFKVFRRSDFFGDFNEIYPLKFFPSGVEVVLSITDTLVKENSVYQYFLLPLDYYQNQGSSSDTVVVAAYNFNSIFPPYDITVAGLDSLGALRLSWRQYQPDKILSLKIFRSTEYDKNYSEIAEVQNADSSYIDRTAQPMVKYFYYLVLNDPFGELSVQSAKVFGLYQSLNLPYPPMNLRSENSTRGVKLIWEKPEINVNLYHVYRALTDEPTLSLIYSVKSSDSLIGFSDTSIILKGNRIYSYAVRAENTSGRVSEFTDTIQVVPKMPASLRAPLQLQGYEENSKVFLYWENLFKTDPSVSGYEVYRRIKQAGSADEKEFETLSDSIISPKQNNFVDTSAGAGNDYEYSVKAMDIYGNQSPFSSSIIVGIKIQRVSPPAAITAISRNEGIFITWLPPFQQEIKEYKIFRYERGEGPQLIASVKAEKATEFLDTTAKLGNLYFYYIKSVDVSNYDSEPSREVGIRK